MLQNLVLHGNKEKFYTQKKLAQRRGILFHNIFFPGVSCLWYYPVNSEVLLYKLLSLKTGSISYQSQS